MSIELVLWIYWKLVPLTIVVCCQFVKQVFDCSFRSNVLRPSIRENALVLLLPKTNLQHVITSMSSTIRFRRILLTTYNNNHQSPTAKSCDPEHDCYFAIRNGKFIELIWPPIVKWFIIWCSICFTPKPTKYFIG